MTALKVIGIMLLILLFIGRLRVGVILCYQEKLTVTLQIGPAKRTVVPKAKRKKKKEKAPKGEPARAEAAATKEEKKRSKLSLGEIYDLVSSVLSGLNAAARRIGKRLRLNPFHLTVIFGGDDPAEVAQKFGTANAVLWTMMPKLEELFQIPDPAIHLDMDYSAPRTVFSGEAELSFRIDHILAFVFLLAKPLLKWYRRYKKELSNGQKPPDAAKTATEKTEEKLSA